MTIMEAISAADKIKPNQFDNVIKTMWLSELDGRIKYEIIDSQGTNGDTAVVYEANSDATLLVPTPYDSIYIYWIIWHIEDALNEQGNANNTYTKFENTFEAFKRWYIRTHKHNAPRIKLWR